MLKELLKDTTELENFISYSNLVDNNFKKSTETVSKRELSKFPSSIFIENPLKKVKLKNANEFSSLDKVRIVVNGFVGDKSVKRICREEGITTDTYETWKANFEKAFNYYSNNYDVNVKFESIAKKIILEQSSLEVYDFFSSYTNFHSNKNFVLPEGEKLSPYGNFNNIQNVVVLNKMNNYRQINKYLEDINEQMPKNGLLFGCFETFTASMNRSKVNNVPVLKQLNAGSTFMFKRVLPKIKYLNKIYFSITKGRNRLLSKAEALGRLVSCGFEIIDVKVINNINYFVVKKVKQPDYNMNPSYGPLFKMNRVGKNGKIIGVYKFRTMHPYSEYLQDYVLKLNGYSETGKPANDFRVVPWAKILRKYWIDELPQLINVLKGEMKLVGIRPVSKTYFNTIPADIQELRLTQKPGCIPPYVALNRKSSVESVLGAEKDYLREKVNNPYFTDLKYFFKAIYNILVKNKRSA